MLKQDPDSATWTTYYKFVTALTAMAVIFDGFDIQILGFAIPSLIREWGVARAAFGPVLAIGLAAMAAGTPLAGYWGDRWGRRSALIGCVTLFGLGTIATSFAHSLTALIWLRVLTGIGVGGALPNAGALAAEFAPVHRRAVAVKLTFVCVPLGGMLAGVFATWLLPSYGWRALYRVGGGLPLVLAAVLWMLLPESPHYVAEKNRAGGRARFIELFGPALRRDTTGLWIAFLFSLGSIYLVFGWLPAMLNSQGFGLAGASEALALYNFGGVAGVLIWAVLIQRSGSRGPMLGAALGAAVTALAILYSGGRRGWALVFITMNGLLANAVQVALYAVAAHIYPTRVRASGMGCAASIGRAGGVVTSIYGSALIVAGPMAYWSTLAGSMAVAFAGIAWIRRHIPQVRN